NWPSGGDSQDGSLGNSGGSGGSGGGQNNNDDPNCIADANGNCIGDVTTPLFVLSNATRVISDLGITDSHQMRWLHANEHAAHSVRSFLVENSFSEEAMLSAKINVELAASGLSPTDLSSPAASSIIQKHIPQLGTPMLMARYTALSAMEAWIIMSEYPDGYEFSDWELFTIAMDAQMEALHLLLDLAGLAPGVGAIFDAANGLLYTVEGDYAGAGLSFAAAIPFLGDWTTVARISKKVFNLQNGKRVFLKIYKMANGMLKFSNRGQLRKVLGIRDSSIHAHHIIPFSLAEHPVVQNAAKFKTETKTPWHMNDIINGVPLPQSLHQTGHKKYTDKIEVILDRIRNDVGDNLELSHTRLTSFAKNLKNIIENNPTLDLGQIADLIIIN
uniref:AHH domain-containing protein n=1 Tax=Ascidiimonas aurantiaca TaxID=1685432 RepID=UPI0030ECA064